jgi:hypothetical protein
MRRFISAPVRAAQWAWDKVPKIGVGHADAQFRLGFAEIRAALYPESNIAQPTPYGEFGTKTPGEVAEDRRADGVSDRDASSERSSAEYDRRVAGARPDIDHRPPEPEADRGPEPEE